ncbi:MAG: TM2 domain-containing protein [Bacteroidales bacterium]|nr:TM2 domain-containing protein [Bacteroidales bacterium]
MTNFLLENQRKFNTVDLMTIKQQLDKMSDKQLYILNSVDFKDPTIALVLSVVVGGWGIDRFYIGDTGLGVLKLITAGGLGVWWLVDLFVISGKTKKNNIKEFQETLMLQESLAE